MGMDPMDEECQQFVAGVSVAMADDPVSTETIHLSWNQSVGWRARDWYQIRVFYIRTIIQYLYFRPTYDTPRRPSEPGFEIAVEF